jgi:hypothetical protein
MSPECRSGAAADGAAPGNMSTTRMRQSSAGQAACRVHVPGAVPPALFHHPDWKILMKYHVDSFIPVRRPKPIPTWLAAIVTILSVAVAVVSYRYLGAAEEIPDQIQSNAFLTPWLAIHAGAAATALLLGPAQFLASLRRRYPGVHRWTGRVYVLGCTVGGASGLLLAAGASTGIVTTAGFGTLAIAWVGVTTIAWCQAVQGRIPEHRQWMIRSFALTLAAVTLRIYLLLAEALEFPAPGSYQAISFLCWVPNMVMAEWYLRRAR